MSALEIFVGVALIGFVLAAAWLAGLFLRAPRGYENSKGFGVDRRNLDNRQGSAADRRNASPADTGQVRSDDRSPQDSRKP